MGLDEQEEWMRRWIIKMVLALILMFIGLLFTSCDTIPVTQGNKKSGIARVTFYNKHEDKYGNRIASSNRKRAIRGRTIAAESRFPFGTIVKIPWLAKLLGTGSYVVEDRGSAVERRKASRGTVPVFDIYTETKKETRRLAAIVPPYLPYEIQ